MKYKLYICETINHYSNKLIMEKYNEILNLFVGKDCREWMRNPFVIGNKVFATDGHMLVAFDSSRVDCSKVEAQDKNKLNRVYPKKDNCSHHISYTLLSEHINKIVKVPEISTNEEEIKCHECDGEGEVEWEFCDSNGRNHYMEDDCPVCGGSGINGKIIKTPTGRMIIPDKAECKIGNSFFRVNLINKIFEVMTILGGVDAELVFQKDKMQASMFRVQDVDILIMPISEKKGRLSFCINF